MFKVDETITHTLTAADLLKQIRERAGLPFAIGAAVIHTPPAADAARTGPESLEEKFAKSLRRSLGISEPTPAKAEQRPYVVIGYDGDGDVDCVTICEHGELINQSLPAAELSLFSEPA